MKKLYFFMCAVVMSITVAKAQQAVAVLTHEGTSKTFSGYNALQDAYKEAAHGDLITLSSGTFASVATIEKAVKIRGAGMEMDTIYNVGPTQLVGNMTLDISDAGSNHFRLEGIYHDYVIYYNHTQERPEFVKCKLTDIRYTTYGDTGGSTYAGTIKNAMFYHCKVSSSFKCGEACSATIINSYIACPYCVSATTSVLDVHNSVLINTGNTYDNMRLYNSTISNSVLASSCEFNSTTTFNNCLLPNTYHPDESKNTYISYEKVRPSDVFKTYNNTSSFWYSSTETFELRPEYNSIYGMYSGDFPYSPRLSGPHIQLMEVAPRTSDAGTLNVRIKVENTIE